MNRWLVDEILDNTAHEAHVLGVARDAMTPTTYSRNVVGPLGNQCLGEHQLAVQALQSVLGLRLGLVGDEAVAPGVPLQGSRLVE